MDLIQAIGAFIVSLTALLASAKYFTDSAEKIGLHFKISPFIIGVTIIALGTSLPEISTSIIAVIENRSSIVPGNVIGSNMANILFVLAIAAVVGKNMAINKNIIEIDLPILLGSVILLFILTLDREFAMFDGILSLLALGTYLAYNTKSNRTLKEKERIRNQQKKEERQPFNHWLTVILIGSAGLLYFSADWTIQAVVEISQIMGVSESVIAISAIAIGTSLPELIVSVMAARKGNIDLAIGNITGSNIFNALGVMGIPAMFGVITIPQDMITFSIPALIFTTILYVIIMMDKKISMWEGFTLLLIYLAFIGKSFGVV